MFKCKICKRVYTRVDGLVRHKKSHTSTNPFPCNICGKHYSRHDILLRHVRKVHRDKGVRNNRVPDVQPIIPNQGTYYHFII